MRVTRRSLISRTRPLAPSDKGGSTSSVAPLRIPASIVRSPTMTVGE